MIGVLREHRWAAACAVLTAVWLSLPNALMGHQRRFFREHFPDYFSSWTNNGSFSTIDSFSTLSDDNYYYAARIGQAASHLVPGDPYVKGNRSVGLALSDLLTWESYAAIWRVIGDARIAWMASQFLFTLLWVPALYLIGLRLGAARGPALFLAVVSTLYADIVRDIGVIMYFNTPRTLPSLAQYFFWFLGSYHYFLGTTRITGPLFTYPCLFLAGLFFVRADEEKGAPWAWLAGICGGLLAYVHADVFLAFMGAGALYAAWSWRRGGRLKPALMLTLSLAVSLPWLIFCRPSADHFNLLGFEAGRHFFVWSLVFLAGAWLCLRECGRQGMGLWCACLLLSMFAASNTSLATGWVLVQGHWFFLGNTFLLLVVGVWAARKLRTFSESDWIWLTALTFLACLSRLVSYSALHYRYYALPAGEQQAYEWLDHNTPPASVVAALSPQTYFRVAAHTHDRIAVSFLFPLMSDISMMENAKRLIYALSLYGVGLEDYTREGEDDSRHWEDRLWLGEADQAGRERAGMFKVFFCALGLEPTKVLLRQAAAQPVEDFKADYVWVGDFERYLHDYWKNALLKTAAERIKMQNVPSIMIPRALSKGGVGSFLGPVSAGGGPNAKVHPKSEWPPKNWTKVFENNAATIYKIEKPPVPGI